MLVRNRLSLSLVASAFLVACSALVAGRALTGCSSNGPGPQSDASTVADAGSLDAAIAEAGDGATTDAGDAPADAGADADDCGVPAHFAWSSTGPILGPISDLTHDLVAIKDPSVVYYNGKWHVFVSTVDTWATTALPI